MRNHRFSLTLKTFPLEVLQLQTKILQNLTVNFYHNERNPCRIRDMIQEHFYYNTQEISEWNIMGKRIFFTLFYWKLNALYVWNVYLFIRIKLLLFVYCVLLDFQWKLNQSFSFEWKKIGFLCCFIGGSWMPI